MSLGEDARERVRRQQAATREQAGIARERMRSNVIGRRRTSAAQALLGAETHLAATLKLMDPSDPLIETTRDMLQQLAIIRYDLLRLGQPAG